MKNVHVVNILLLSSMVAWLWTLPRAKLAVFLDSFRSNGDD